MLSLIACISKNRGLGLKNQLLYKIPADQKFFREKTLNHPVIMGKNTFLSIGRPLPKRRNIVVTHDKNFKADGALVCHSINEALQKASNHGEIFIIGGAQIYEQTIGRADKLYLTIVDEEKPTDAFFPAYDDFKKSSLILQGEHQGIKYTLFELTK